MKYFRLDVLMMSILDKENLTGERKENKLKVIKILGEFLRESNSPTVVPKIEQPNMEQPNIEQLKSNSPTWDRERDDNAFSWLGWTVVNGTAEDVAALISSRQPFDPLLGMVDS